jgi:hypothetical protein
MNAPTTDGPDNALITGLRRLLARHPGEDVAEMIAVFVVVCQIESVRRAGRLAVDLIESDGRLSKRARQIAAGHVRAADAAWLQAPAVEIIIEHGPEGDDAA